MQEEGGSGGAGSLWPQHEAGRGSKLSKAASAKEPASPAGCSRGRAALHTPAPAAQEEINLASLCESSRQHKQRTLAQEENSAAPQFIAQESQTKALAPSAALKPFCMWSLRRGLARALTHRDTSHRSSGTSGGGRELPKPKPSIPPHPGWCQHG